MIERLRWYRQLKGGNWCLTDNGWKVHPCNERYTRVEMYGPVEVSPVLAWIIYGAVIVFSTQFAIMLLYMLGAFQ